MSGGMNGRTAEDIAWGMAETDAGVEVDLESLVKEM